MTIRSQTSGVATTGVPAPPKPPVAERVGSIGTGSSATALDVQLKTPANAKAIAAKNGAVRRNPCIGHSPGLRGVCLELCDLSKVRFSHTKHFASGIRSNLPNFATIHK